MRSYITALIVAMPGLIAAWQAWRVKRDVREVHLSLNSRLDKFVSMAEDVARAEGRDSERATPSVVITTTEPPVVTGDVKSHLLGSNQGPPG